MEFSSIIGETLREISNNDRQFLKLMDQKTIKKHGHYVVSLPLKSKNVNLRYNRVLALKRLNCFHRRFLKDDHFYEMYKTSIADMIAKGYARRAGKYMVHDQEIHGTYLTMGLFIQQNQEKSM